jgi:antitoxin component of MazEF toxin-antitoxin module
MSIYLSCYLSEVIVQCPVLSADGGAEGMLRQVVRPKEDFYGYSYDALRVMGDGRHDLDVIASTSNETVIIERVGPHELRLREARSLAELLAGVTPENLHGEWKTGPAVGEEAL